jgi:alpha-1,2-mannosyltransferase
MHVEIVEEDTAARAADLDRPEQSEPTREPSRAWVVLGVLSAAVVLAGALVLTEHQLDFDVYRMGGANVLGQSLYSVRLPASEFREFFTYTPFAALLFWPAAHVPKVASQAVWSTLNCTALLALIALSIKVAGGVRFSWRVYVPALVCMLPTVALEPVALSLYYGQVNFLIALMVLGDLTCVVGLRRHTLPRGVLVGLAAAIKLTPLIFVPFLFLTRQFRAGLTALASFWFWTVFALALAPRSSWLYWTKDVFDTHRVGSTWFVSNQNLVGALERLVGHAPSPVLLLCFSLVFAVGGLLLAAEAYRRSSPLLGVLLCAATGLLVSPISWTHHYVWIVPALAWLVLAADRPRHWRWWAAGATILFVVAPMSSVPSYLHHYSNPLQYAQGNAFFLAALAFVVLTSAMVWRRARSRGRTGSGPGCGGGGHGASLGLG